MPALLSRPEVTPEIRPYYEAWNLLDSRRTYNESGIQPIPMSDMITTCCIFLSDDPDDIQDFCVILSVVDAYVLNESAKKRKREIERQASKNRLKNR